MRKPPPQLHFDVDKIDERWMAEWLAYGYRELRAYLAHHAAFDEYLDRTNRKEHDQ